VSSPTNNVKVEVYRISGVPVNLSTAFNSGDMMKWDSTNHVATPMVSGDAASAAAAAAFIGVSQDTNPIPSLNQNLPEARINIVNRGIVALVTDDNSTYFPGDKVTLGADPQKIKKSGVTASPDNSVGVVAPENFFNVTGGASVGIVAVQGTTVLLISLRPQFVNLSTI
jgi:hypothetical protein